ncbi:hypothetical protein IF1G_11102 [Cordyceps javanica]|uniref:Retrovirus-related Pol polyprotein from transposon TNT 1-94-like beta-barrel domain-containing protein n=1 Tax=Cordyceps javanica TaxID=43265 RepID=A0A545UL73_9HYPO|nr:hypothetical protein IF1G_11102 [Cordyceps javanica]TQW01660.1 hypothetical protein IF2G_10801 [Cordyceps javanica]
MDSDHTAFLRVPAIKELRGAENWESWRLFVRIQLQAAGLAYLLKPPPDGQAEAAIQKRAKDELKALAFITPYISPQIMLDLSRQGWQPTLPLQETMSMLERMLSMVPETSIPELFLKFFSMKITPQQGIQKVLNTHDEILAAFRIRYTTLDALFNDMSATALLQALSDHYPDYHRILETELSRDTKLDSKRLREWYQRRRNETPKATIFATLPAASPASTNDDRWCQDYILKFPGRRSRHTPEGCWIRFPHKKREYDAQKAASRAAASKSVGTPANQQKEGATSYIPQQSPGPGTDRIMKGNAFNGTAFAATAMALSVNEVAALPLGRNSIIVDSGCNVHTFNDRAWFSELTYLPKPRDDQLSASGHNMLCIGVGTAVVPLVTGHSLQLRNVRLVPDAPVNMISQGVMK